MSATFQDLPVDIFDEIASHLPHSALSKLARCSWESFEFFGPILYRKLILYRLDGCEIALISETLVLRPRLADAVKEIHAEDWEVDITQLTKKVGDQPWWIYSNGQSEKEKTSGSWHQVLFLDRIWRATRTEGERKQWLRDLKIHDADVCMGLLLTLVPNLTELKIPYPVASNYVPWVIDRASDSAFKFLSELSWVFFTSKLSRFSSFPQCTKDNSHTA